MAEPRSSSQGDGPSLLSKEPFGLGVQKMAELHHQMNCVLDLGSAAVVLPLHEDVGDWFV
jgi:hypothetical protein